MSSAEFVGVIPCSRVVKVNFKGNENRASESLSSMARITSKPNLHPSISNESLSSLAVKAIVSPGRNAVSSLTEEVEIVAQRNPATFSRPPKTKQLRNIQDLCRQYQNRKASDSSMPFIYVIDAKWMIEWAQYVSNASPNQNEEPGPIDNRPLLGNGTLSSNHTMLIGSLFQESGPSQNDLEELKTFKLPLQPGLQDGIDLFLLPCEIWDALYSWYHGGPAIPRFLCNSVRFSTSFLPLTAGFLSFLFSPEEAIALCRGLEYPKPDSIMRDLYPVLESLPCVDDINTTLSVSSASSPAKAGKTIAAYRTLTLSPSKETKHSTEDGSDESLSPVPTPTPAAVDELVQGVKNISLGHNEAKSSGSTVDSTLSTIASSKADSNNETKNPCCVCGTPASNKCSSCKFVHYCSRECQTHHWSYHRLDCKKTGASITASINNKGVYKKPRLFRLGLGNLGNTCYMSSSLQCLLSIAPLSSYFLSQRYETDINATNRDGTKGALCKAYAKLLRDMSFDKNINYIRPIELKRILGTQNVEFLGMAQHDAHEVIELLLDKLHEDLNKVKSKSYTEKVEGDGTNDFAIARETYHRHSLREDSYIRDLCGSMMRSQLTCPQCHKVSVSYEYHTSIETAIPNHKRKQQQQQAMLNNSVDITVIFIPEIRTHAPNKLTTNMLNDLLSVRKHKITVDRTLTIGHLPTMLLNRHLPASMKSYVNGGADSVLGGDPLDMHCFIRTPSEPVEVEEEEKKDAQKTAAEGEIGQDEPWSMTLIPGKVSIGSLLSKLAVQEIYCFAVDGGPTDELQQEREKDDHVYAFVNLAIQQEQQQDGAVPIMKRSKSDSSEEDEDDEFSFTGPPFLLHFNLTWRPMRVLTHIWLNGLCRSFKGDSPYRVEGLQTAMSVKMKEMMTMMEALTVRLINGRGGGVVAAFTKQLSLINKVSIPSAEVCQGSQLPATGLPKTLTFGEWLGDLTRIIQGSNGGGAWMMLSLQVPLSLRSQLNWPLLRAMSEIVPPPPSALQGNNLNNKMKVNDQVITLQECLEEYTKEEQLEAGNEWYCSTCQKHQLATKVVSFCPEYLPKVLILTLKRFEFRQGAASSYSSFGSLGQRDKIDTFVDFPLNALDLAPYCNTYSQSNKGGEQEPPARTESTEPIFYDLFAVCNHYGRMGFGHYTSHVREWRMGGKDDTLGLGEQWLCCDDEHVSVVHNPEREVKTSSGYILFYRRR